MPRVAVWTDKAGRRIVKGVRAEEEYRLIDILSGCIVKSYMSVTGMKRRLNTEDVYVSWMTGGVLRNEDDFMTLRWHCRRSVLYVIGNKYE